MSVIETRMLLILSLLLETLTSLMKYLRRHRYGQAVETLLHFGLLNALVPFHYANCELYALKLMAIIDTV